MMNTSDGNFDREIVAAKFMIGFFKILGLAPFDVKKSSDRKLFKNGNGQGFSQMQLVSSRRGCFYNLLLIVLQLRIFVAVWPGADELEYPDVTTLTAAIATAQSVLHNVVLYLILLTLGLRQKTVVKLLNRLISVDSSTFDRHKDYFSDTSGRFFFLVLFMGIIVWTVTLVTQYIGHHSAVVTWFRSILPFFVITCFEIKYVFVLNLIGKRFRALNRALLRNSDRSAVEFEDRLFFTRDLLIKDPCGPTVNSIRRAHTNLYEISMGISDYYSLPILFAIGGVTYTALYVTYYMVAPFFAPVGNGSAWIVCNCTSWLIIVMTPIILLASGVTNVAKEVGRHNLMGTRKLTVCCLRALTILRQIFVRFEFD